MVDTNSHAVRLPFGEQPRSPAPSRRARIVRCEYRDSHSLQPAQRSALIDRCYAVYCATLRGCTRDEFEAIVCGGGNVHFALFYGARDEFAGCCYARIDRVEHAGRMHAVLSAGVLFRPGYHAGASGALFLLRQVLRAKLRDPRTPLAYMTRCTTPAVYRRLAKTMPRVYPSRNHEPPDDVEALVRVFSARWGYVPVGESAWIVQATGIPHDTTGLRRLEHDPDVQWYLERNPRFDEGESLVVWTRAELPDIVVGFARALRGRLSR